MFQIRKMVFSAASLLSCLMAMIAMAAMIALGSLVVSFLKSLPQNRLWCYLWSFLIQVSLLQYINCVNHLRQEKHIQSSWPCLDWAGNLPSVRGGINKTSDDIEKQKNKIDNDTSYYDMMILPNCVFRAHTQSFDYCLDQCLLWRPPSGWFNSEPNLITWKFLHVWNQSLIVLF